MSTIEIFTDESFVRGNACVAGLIVIHNREFGAFHSDLFSYLTQRLGLWGVCSALCNSGTNWNTVLPNGIKALPKGKALRIPPEQEFDVLEQTLRDAGAHHIAAFGARKTDSSPIRRWEPTLTQPITRPLLDKLLDRRVFDLLKQALEIIVFEMKETVQTLQNGGRLAIDLASRVVPCDRDALDALELARLEWGINVDAPDYTRVFSIGSGDGTQIFDEVVALRGGFYVDSAPKPKVIRARVTNLLDWSWPQSPSEAREKRIRPHQIHYLADWIAHILWDDRDWITQNSVPTLKRWLEAGFDIDLARHTESEEWLSACRAWGTKSRIEAVKKAAKLRNNPQRVLRDNVRRWSADLKGEELAALFTT